MVERFSHTVDRIAQSEPIDPNSIDYTLNDQALVRKVFGVLLPFPQATEAEVPTSEKIVRTLLPNMDGEHNRYWKVWLAQEGPHAPIIGKFMEEAGIAKLPLRQTVRPTMQFAGRLARISPGIHDALQLTVSTYSGIGEAETVVYYMKAQKLAQDIGEFPLSNALDRILEDERGHKAAFTVDVREQLKQMKPWQLRLRRKVLREYSPIGTHKGKKDEARRRQLGRIAFILGGDDINTLLTPIENFAGDLLEIIGDHPNPNIRRAYEECVEEYLQEEAVRTQFSIGNKA